MSSLYRKIKEFLLNWSAWTLDYIYVSFWQVHGFFNRSDYSHYLSPKSKTGVKKIPVLLIPGIYENWQFMKPVADILHERNHPVHIVSALGYNRADVDVMAEVVHDYVHEKNLTNYIIVAHSKGGLIAKALLLSSAGQDIKGVIALNTPFKGSQYAYLTPIKSLRIFLPNSSILLRLSKNSTANNKIISIYGIFDPHIPKGSHLKGAKNIKLQTRGHFRIMGTTDTHQAIIWAIDSFKT